MARLLVAGLLGAAAVSPLLAQPAPVAPMATHAPMTRAPMTRADLPARIAAQFAKRDTNRDGFLAADELQARDGQRGQRMMLRRSEGGPDGAMVKRDPDAAFDRLDANHDGTISRAEFGQARQVRIEKRVMIDGQPGEVGPTGRPGAMRGMHRGGHGGGGMMGAALLRRADTNRDGRVSLAEATGAALQHFDMVDTNRDGRITPEERAAGRARMMPMRQAG